MTTRIRLAALLTLTLGLSACVADDPDAGPRPDTTTPGTTNPTRNDDITINPFGMARMYTGGSCPQILEVLQNNALEHVTAWGFDDYWNPYWRGGPDMAVDMATPEMAFEDGSIASTPDPTAGADYSDTNTQEAGVDEADIIETDGRYLYIAGNEEIEIVNIDNAELAATIELEPGQHRLILDATDLIVITTSWDQGQQTLLRRIDISDPRRPDTVQTDTLEGNYVAARSSGGVVRVIMQTTLADRFDFVTPNEFGYDEASATTQNQRVILDSSIDDWTPRRLDDNGTIIPAVDCENIAVPATGADITMTWVASLDLGSDTKAVGSLAVATRADTIYATGQQLYAATTDWAWDRNNNVVTTIHRFDAGEDTQMSYTASGDIPGTTIGQFALSHYDDTIRVASTYDRDGISRSRVGILEVQGDQLVEIGAVNDLGLTERIYAVRYIGPTAYVVTFRQTDPLYVLDLSDPTQPEMQGELKIPGYSSYLHPAGDGLLIGLGQNADDMGRVLGTQLSLFDVNDPTNPTRIDQLDIGGYSEAEWNHLAFLYWPADGTIAVPNTDGSIHVTRLENRRLDAVGEIRPTPQRGRPVPEPIVILDDEISSSMPDDSRIYCWDDVRRALAVNDELIVITQSSVYMHDRDTLEYRRGITVNDTYC